MLKAVRSQITRKEKGEKSTKWEMPEENGLTVDRSVLKYYCVSVFNLVPWRRRVVAHEQWGPRLNVVENWCNSTMNMNNDPEKELQTKWNGKTLINADMKAQFTRPNCAAHHIPQLKKNSQILMVIKNLITP